MSKKILTTLLTLVLAFNGIAQEWSSLTIRDGLSGMSVFRIKKDQNQLVWMGTSNGVTLFNGQTTYRFPLVDNSQGPASVQDLAFMKSGEVIAASQIGLYALKQNTDKFVPILPDVKRAETLLAVGDTLYIGGYDGLSASFDNGRSSTVLLKAALNSLDNSVRCLRKGPDGAIWFTTAHQLNRYDPKTGEIEAWLGYRDEAMGRFDFANGKIFLGTKNNGLLICHIDERTCEPLIGIDKIISDVNSIGDSLVYIGTDGDGAYVVDARTQEITEHYATDQQGPHRLKSNAVYCFEQDRQGITWVGFFRNGMSYQSSNDLTMETFEHGNFTTEGQNVNAFLKDGDNILIGAVDAVSYHNLATGVTHTFPATMTGRSIVANIVPFGPYYYICYYDGGVERLNRTTLRLEGPPMNIPSFRTESFTAVALSPEGELWLSNNDGVWVIDSVGKCTNYNEHNSRIFGNPASDILFDQEGNGWLAFPDGIAIYARHNHSFSTDEFPKEFFNNQPYLHLRQRADGRIIAFGQRQFYYTDPQMMHFGQMAVSQNILNEICIDLVDDRQGHFWIATESGVFQTGYDMHIIRQLPIGHGLDGTQVNRLYNDEDGRLWIATQNGLITASSDRLKTNTQKGVGMIPYNIVVGDEPMDISELLQTIDTKTIRVPWNLTSRTLRMNVISTDYSSQQKRFYEYCLDDDSMRVISEDEDIVIERMLLGRHRLNIQMAGEPTTRCSFTIVVRPTTFFYVGSLFFVVLIIWLYSWWHYRKNTRNIIAEHIETEQALIEESQAQWQEQSEERKEKYAKVQVDEQKLKKLYECMDHYIVTQRPYLNPDFRMSNIAQALDVSTSVLSQVFTFHAKESYYDYINRHRLQTFKQMIDEGRHHHLTIAALSEQCGFKRSSFFSTFRKFEGMTPYEYIKKLDKN